MKLKRLLCGALAAVLSFSLLIGPGGLALPARAAEETPTDATYEKLRQDWRAYLLGGTGTDLDTSNDAIKAYVDDLNADANTYWNQIKKNTTNYGYAVFPDLDMTPMVVTETTTKDEKTTAEVKAKVVNMVTTLRRLVTLAKAYSTQGCTLYQNETVLAEIISATDYVVNNILAKNGVKYTKATSYGNWYEWDISGPTALGNITVILYDQLTADQVTLYAETIKHYAGEGDCSVTGPNSLCETKMTGANLLLKAYNVAVAGILLKEAALLENVRTNVKSTVSAYNTPDKLFATDANGDGFYADGSYIQHYALPYVAGYGEDLFNNFSVFFRMFKGTPWEIGYAADEDPLIFNFIFDGVEPFLAGGRTMDMVAGRDIARGNRNDRVRTATFLNALLGMRGTFPSDEQNKRFDEMVKYHLSKDPEFYYSNMSSIVSIKAASEIMKDDNIQPRSGYTLTKVFAMDRAVHHTDSFALGIAMQSTRIFSYEIITNQGLKSWNTANGMVYLYDTDKNQYSDGYWCTVDPTRLPGITAEHTTIPTTFVTAGNAGNTTNVYDWTGGSVLGNNGVAGMHMKALSKNDTQPTMYVTGTRTGADMKKSYFMFGDRILMLGSSITSTTGDHVETTVENRKLDGANVVTVDNKTPSLGTNPTTLKNPEWLHITGNADGSDVGYYFPENITLQAIRDTRTGKWTEQGTQVSGVTTGDVTNTYATFYVDHGANPTDAGYAYVLLPGRSADDTAAYAAAPDIEIIQNDGSVHAAHDTKQGIVAANFWEAGTVEGISVSAPASVIMQENKDGTVTVGVADPTQKADSITVTLAMTGTGFTTTDKITMNPGKLVSFTVNTAGKLGQTQTLTFTKGQDVDGGELLGVVGALEPITVEFGTPFYEIYEHPDLPKTAKFKTVDGREYELELDWRRGDYDTAELGEFTIEGHPKLIGELKNTGNVCATMKVKTRGEEKVEASADTFTQYGDSNAESNAKNQNLRAGKNATATSTYNRNAYIQFNVEDIPSGTSHKLVFTASGYKDDRPQVNVDLTYGDIAISDLTWDTALTLSDVTWTDAAANFTINEAAKVIVGQETTWEVTESNGTKTNRHRAVLSIDVTDAVNDAIVNAKTAKKSTITFKIAVENNQTFEIYSLENTTANAQKPAIISEPISGEATTETVTVTTEIPNSSPKKYTETYTQDGPSNENVVKYNAHPLLIAKGNSGFDRKVYLQFDLTKIPAGAESHTLAMTAYDYQASHKGRKVYADLTYDDLNLTKMTHNSPNPDDASASWNNVSWSTTPVDQFTLSTTKDDGSFADGVWRHGTDRFATVMSFDVTNAINTAKTQGKTKVTFRLTFDNNASMSIYASSTEKNENTNKQPIAIISEVTVGGVTVDKNNLSHLITEAGKVEATKFLPYDTTALQQAVTDGETVKANADATQTQVNDAEDALMRILLALRYDPKKTT